MEDEKTAIQSFNGHRGQVYGTHSSMENLQFPGNDTKWSNYVDPEKKLPEMK